MNASPRLNVATYTLAGFGLLWASAHALTVTSATPTATLPHNANAPATQLMAQCTEAQCDPNLEHPRH